MTDEFSDHIEKHRIYGKVKMHDGSSYRGFFYAKEGERLQDLLNDQRDFLPIQLVRDAPPYKPIGTVILAKRYIILIEEIEYNPLFV